MAQVALSFEKNLFTFKFTEHKLKKTLENRSPSAPFWNSYLCIIIIHILFHYVDVV